MSDLSVTIYVEPPRCSHRSLDNGGFCYACGATLRWVVEKEVDYEAAEASFIVPSLGWADMARKCVDAAIGGDDE